MNPQVMTPLGETLMSGYITQGKKVEEFEQALMDFLQTPYLLTLNSATAGLTLALRLLKKTDAEMSWPGFNDSTDIVLTPALTCFATTAAILANGANIRWLDVDLDTANISLNDLESKLSEHTKVVYLVHWGGTPVDLDALCAILDRHREKYGFRPMVVEDCAHAFGAKYNGKYLGNHGNICVYSSQAIKQLTTVDGGFITLPNKTLYDRCKLLRWYGIDRNKRSYSKTDFRLENDVEEWGYKFHMNDVCATIGLANLSCIQQEVLDKNNENALIYRNALSKIHGVKLMCVPEQCESANWLFTVRVQNKQNFIKYMSERNIMVSQVHNRNDINSCVSMYNEQLPNLDILEQEIVCIPVGWWLSNDDISRIIESIRAYSSHLNT